MKKILFMLLAFICFTQSDAQTSVKPKYDTCNNLSSLNGEWKYVNGIDTIRIYFRAHRSKSVSFNSITDDLWGWIEYSKGDNIVESTYQNRFAILPYETDNLPTGFESLTLRADSCSNITSLFGTLIDFSQGKEIKKVKATLNVAGNMMTWKQDHIQGYGVISGFFGMTLPKDFTLTKQ